MTLPLLKVAPPLALRKETVELPELGGAVIVRGLRASEAFAVTQLRQQALLRLRIERSEARAQADDGAVLPPPSNELDFGELVQYGQHVSHLLAAAVEGEGGLAFYSADEWEIFAQHHPDAYRRLQLVAERLSGMNPEAVAKN